MTCPIIVQERALPLPDVILGIVWAHTTAHIFHYLRIWEVPKNNEGGVYLFLQFQVFDSFPKPYAQKAILQSLIWHVLLALSVWEIPLKYSSYFTARRHSCVVWVSAHDFIEEIIALYLLKHVLEKICCSNWQMYKSRLINGAFWSCFHVLFNKSLKPHITGVHKEGKLQRNPTLFAVNLILIFNIFI